MAAEVIVLPEYERALKLIRERIPLVIVSGGAGTGKSTFIRWLVDGFDGRVLVVAPTGLAALNVSGKTIHSLLRYPPGWIIPTDISKLRSSPIKVAQVLVVDEMSMVNANVMDAIDISLRKNLDEGRPFGGLSVVLVGDLFQLPPVVGDSLKEVFKANYKSPHFFSAKCLKNISIAAIELKTSFRQQDGEFSEILNNLREGKKLTSSVAALNRRVKVSDTALPGAVLLTPTNAQAEDINFSELNKIDSKVYKSVGKIEGKFSDDSLPVPKNLELKVGAQVIIKKNVLGAVNGDLGIVERVNPKSAEVRVFSSNKLISLTPTDWEQFDYVLDPETKNVKRKVVGTYRQYPLSLAWAITIHKSQGLTLDKVHLDLSRGPFATGQFYVAISRVRRFQDLTLTRPLRESDFLVDGEASRFYEKFRAAST